MEDKLKEQLIKESNLSLSVDQWFEVMRLMDKSFDLGKEEKKEPEVKKIRFYKHDDLAGFAAYLSPSMTKDEHGIVLLDIEASLATALENEISFKEILIENMMHEFGHAMEEFYGLEFSEDRIEKIIESYYEKHKPNKQ